VDDLPQVTDVQLASWRRSKTGGDRLGRVHEAAL
jgi:hypothetical protein